jgi:hypothetical protein
MAPFLNSMTSAYYIEFGCPTRSAFRFRPCFILPETGQVYVNWSLSSLSLLATTEYMPLVAYTRIMSTPNLTDFE